MRYIEIKAPAKINIGLNILSKRTDGYHNLSTLFYPISDLFDTLTFELSERFEFRCSSASIPCDDSNLVVKAKNLLEKFCGRYLRVVITLEKRIPSQAGLGGGSSDAAAALLSLNELFSLNLSYDKLLELALELGSDVPFFLRAKPAIGTSRGEKLEPVSLEINNPILIVNPKILISTKEAFAQITPMEDQFDFRSVITNGHLDYSKLTANVKNDFEENIFRKHPEISVLKDLLMESGALYSSMSGSGSTVFGIFPDIDTASKTKGLLPMEYFSFLSSREE
jgi:4-diphosphocytidyl-2-C-methyl-D-erythritol kinase